MKRLVLLMAFLLGLVASATPGVVRADPVSNGPTMLSFTGAGGLVPENVGTGASFDIQVDNPGLILPAGDNVSLTLIGVQTNDAYGPADFWYPYGGLVNFQVTLEHIGYGPARAAFSHPLDPQSFICTAGLNGTYMFLSGSPATLQSACGTGDPFNENHLVPPGTYATADPAFSSAWDAQPVAGTWRLNVQNIDMNTGLGQFLMNTTWTWRIDVQVAGIDSCMDGGWEAFGVFANQGDCVSYIATNGGNPPGIG